MNMKTLKYGNSAFMIKRGKSRHQRTALAAGNVGGKTNERRKLAGLSPL
jgi:hypothetical protein